jgi:glucosamine kinase
MELVIGIDAGGTGTRALVADAVSLTVLGRGSAGPGNPVSIGSAAAAVELAAAVEAALAGLPRSAVVGVAAGVAGVSAVEPEVYQARLGLPIRFFPDAVTAFAAGSGADSGTVLIAGTGAVAATVEHLAVGRVADGLGWLLGDEGSGAWLGLAAARAAARAWRSPVAHLVARHAATDSHDAMVRWGNAARPDELAALAPGVCTLARAGDPDATRIVDAAAACLHHTLSTVDSGGPLVLAGGLLSTDTPVRAALLARLAAKGRTALIAGDPALGAARLAR